MFSGNPSAKAGPEKVVKRVQDNCRMKKLALSTRTEYLHSTPTAHFVERDLEMLIDCKLGAVCQELWSIRECGPLEIMRNYKSWWGRNFGPQKVRSKRAFGPLRISS